MGIEQKIKEIAKNPLVRTGLTMAMITGATCTPRTEARYTTDQTNGTKPVLSPLTATVEGLPSALATATRVVAIPTEMPTAPPPTATLEPTKVPPTPTPERLDLSKIKEISKEALGEKWFVRWGPDEVNELIKKARKENGELKIPLFEVVTQGGKLVKVMTEGGYESLVYKGFPEGEEFTFHSPLDGDKYYDTRTGVSTGGRGGRGNNFAIYFGDDRISIFFPRKATFLMPRKEGEGPKAGQPIFRTGFYPGTQEQVEFEKMAAPGAIININFYDGPNKKWIPFLPENLLRDPQGRFVVLSPTIEVGK